MSKKKIIRIIISILSAAAIILLLSVFVSNFFITVNSYDYNISNSSDVKIVFLSDLHGREFGKNNVRLIKKISEQKPDIICLTGDFIDENNTYKDNGEFLNLVKALLNIAPVYYSYGNHDYSYFIDNGFGFIETLENSGCEFLDKEYVDIDIEGVPLRLGGIYDYAFNLQGMRKSDWENTDIFKFLSDFTSTDRTTVLMCHRPDSFIYGDASLIWNIDLVLCGHTHGGLWRLPFIGGVIAPEQGFNPAFDKGEYDIGNIKMFINAGLAGYGINPRLFNLPEVTVINLGRASN